MKLLAIALTGLLALAVLGSAIFVVVARHDSRTQFTVLERLVGERDELNIEWGRLQLEQATWADPHRIEQVATRDLGMRFTPPSERRVLP